jgi:hypothetical protein
VFDSILVATGLLTALVIDWAIYTHLSPFLSIGLALEKDFKYRDLISTRWQKIRLLFVAITGALGGLAFVIHDPQIWIFSISAFAIGHSLIYVYVFKK